MKVAEIVKNCFNNTSFTPTNKASNMAMSVSSPFISIHNLRFPMIHNCFYTTSMFVKVLKVLVPV